MCPGSVCGVKSNETNRLWLYLYWSGPQFLGWCLLVSWEKRFSIGKNLLTSECHRKGPSLDKSANSVWLKGKWQSATGAGAVRHPRQRLRFFWVKRSILGCGRSLGIFRWAGPTA